MQSSYNLIKKDKALSGESRTISTKYIKVEHKPEKIIDLEFDTNEEDSMVNEQFDEKEFLRKYEEMAQEILADAEKKKNEILKSANEKSALMEKKAYETGYLQGKNNGFEDGKKEAYESIVPKAQEEANNIIEKAENVLKNAENNYKEYIEEKQNDILKLAVKIAEQVLRKELVDNGEIANLVNEAIKVSKIEENIIIKCNSVHEEVLKKHIEMWKNKYSISGEIFILPVDSMEPGNAIIEKNNGIVKVGIDTGLEKVKEVIFNKKCE